MQRVVILSPILHSEPRWWKSVVNMVAYSWHHGIRVEEMGITERDVVDWARNNLAKAALEKRSDFDGQPYTHFLWLDSDHIFNPDMLVHLMKRIEPLPKPAMLSALYFGRKPPFLPVAYVKDKNPDPHKHYPLVGVPNSIARLDAVGFGALLMEREVMERVPEPWFTIDWRAGEDIAFCVKARAYGVKIFVDGTYRLGHIGEPQIVTEATYQQYLKEHPDEFADKVRVNLGE